MKYELRCGTRNGKYFIDKTEANEEFTILVENQGIWGTHTVSELEELIEDANKAEELEDYVLYVRRMVKGNEMPLTLEEYRKLLEEEL